MRRGEERYATQAVAAQTMIQMEQWMPPNVLAQATRLGFSSRLYNLLVTNVPGPQFPVYLLGRRMLDVYPIAFLAPEHTLAIAILSFWINSFLDRFKANSGVTPFGTTGYTTMEQKMP